MKKLNKKGFTIVELVIVIAVIAILAAVLIPTFSGVVEKANKSAANQAATNAAKVMLSEQKDAQFDESVYFDVTQGSNHYYYQYSNGAIAESTSDAVTAIAGNADYKSATNGSVTVYMNKTDVGEIDATTPTYSFASAQGDDDDDPSVVEATCAAGTGYPAVTVKFVNATSTDGITLTYDSTNENYYLSGSITIGGENITFNYNPDDEENQDDYVTSDDATHINFYSYTFFSNLESSQLNTNLSVKVETGASKSDMQYNNSEMWYLTGAALTEGNTYTITVTYTD